jgi:hypothetical protein
MKILKTVLPILLIAFQLQAQTGSTLYGIVRQNYYSLVTDPFDSTITYQQFDSATIRMGFTDPAVGFVSNSGTSTYNQAINLTGAALNPYDNTYIFLGGYGINTFDIATGNIINQVAMNNPLGFSYFDNFRFNNADSSMYGLSRRDYFDPITNSMQPGVFLAKANTLTGLLTEISPVAVAPGFSYSGSAIDPYQMVYYFALGNNLIGLDLYNGSVYSNVSMSITDGFAFGNFTYSCADTGLYGLVRQNYFSYIPDTLFPGDSIQILDSATIKLGKVDPATGIVTNISPGSVIQGGYTINGGAAIDPDNMIYYFSTGNSIVGVSLVTGLVTSNSGYTFADGQYFDLMRNFENCISASPLRTNPNITSIDEKGDWETIELYPNPITNYLVARSNSIIKQIEINQLDGRKIYSQEANDNKVNVDMSAFINGMYIVKLITANNQEIVKKVVKY